MGRSDAEAEAASLWSHDDKSQLTGKDPDAGKDWRQEEKGTTEDEMVDGIPDSMDRSLSKLRERVRDREAWCCSPWGQQRVGHDWVTEQAEVDISWWRIPYSLSITDKAENKK